MRAIATLQLDFMQVDISFSPSFLAALSTGRQQRG